MVSLMVTSASLRSFSRPLVTICSPALRPSVTTIRSPWVAPVLMKRCLTISLSPVSSLPCMSFSPGLRAVLPITNTALP